MSAFWEVQNAHEIVLTLREFTLLHVIVDTGDDLYAFWSARWSRFATIFSRFVIFS